MDQSFPGRPILFQSTKPRTLFIPPDGTATLDARKEAIIRKTFAERNSGARKGKPTTYRKMEERTMKKMLILFPLVLALIIASTTLVLAAGPPIKVLKGEFTTIGTRSCVQTNPNKFGSGPQYKLLDEGSTRVSQSAGVLTLFGDRTGSWTGKFLTINNQSVEVNNYPVMVSWSTCEVSVGSLPGELIVLTYKSCDGNIESGYLAGSLTGSDTDVVEFARLSGDGTTMMFWNINPGAALPVERTWVTTNTVTTYYDRICSRTGTAVRMR